MSGAVIVAVALQKVLSVARLSIAQLHKRIVTMMELYKVEPGLSRTRSVDECKAELERELAIRHRCYRKWISDGKLSRSEAAERFERMATALTYLDTVTISSAGEADDASGAAVNS